MYVLLVSIRVVIIIIIIIIIITTIVIIIMIIMIIISIIVTWFICFGVACLVAPLARASTSQ